MVKNNDRWSALSLKDRADLMNMYITNGISDLKEMKKHYNGIPYRDLNTSDYDYFNASPEMAPTEEGQHWDSRNPHTGRLLKGENHPTFDLMVEGENKAGYKIVRGYNGELYSIPNTPDNYVENYNSYGPGGDLNENTSNKKEPIKDYIRRKLYDNVEPGVSYGGYIMPAFIEVSPATTTQITGEDYYETEGTLPQYKCGGRLNKFGNGTSDKYNVFNDKNAFTARDAHINSLKEFIKNNPEIKGLKTNDFFEFFSQLAGLESTYNSLAGEKMKYSGLYGLEGGRNYDINTQHKKAYEHLAKLFKSSIVQEDLQKGLELGYTPAQILAKYWNQGNRVTNFLHRGVDNQDGVGTNISDYGWNMTANVDYNKYLQKGITDDYVIVKPGVYLSNVALKSRNDDVDYSDATKSIINLNTKIKQHNTKNKDAKFDTSRLQVGDTIWLKKPPYLK